jgi:hypothetical protein
MARKIEHEVPEPGSVYRHTFKGQEHVMTVVKEAGEIRFLVSGRSYPSPSGAAVAITGKPTNGWLFWNIVKAPADTRRRRRTATE